MFPTVDINKEKYYYHAAKRFMMDAQMLRCRAAIHVEDKDDILFWSKILNNYQLAFGEFLSIPLSFL